MTIAAVRPERTSPRAVAVLSLAALAAAGTHLGPLSTTTYRVLAGFLLTALLVLVGSARRCTIPQRTLLALGVSLGSTLLVTHAPGTEGALLAVTAVIGLASALARGCAESAADALEDVAGAGLVLTLWMFLSLRVAPFWIAIDDLTRSTTAALGRVTGAGTTLGPSVAGVPLVVLAGAFLVLRALRGEALQRRLVALCAGWLALIVALAWGLGIPLLLRAVTWIASHGSTSTAAPVPGYPASVATFLPLALWLALSVPIAALGVIVMPRYTDLPERDRRPVLLLAAAALSSIVIAAPSLRLPGSGAAPRVVIATGGMTQWDVPSPDRLGLERLGMFGQLPRYLEAAGFRVQLSKHALDEDSLAQADVVAVINPTEPPAPEALARLDAFVERGGGLVVLGDHTDLSGIMAPLNALTARYGISFRFDSAFTPSHWHNDAGFFPHPLTRGLDDADNRFQQSTGASLAVRYGAQPIATARWGFSDLGNRDNTNAFLGDYMYQAREALGDLPVLAVAPRGRGHVVVFGDTSAFQNIALPYSFEFVTRVFQVAAAQNVPFAGAASALALAAWGFLALFALRRGRVVPLALASLAGLAAGTLVDSLAEPTRLPSAAARPALVDAAHFNAVSLDTWEPRAIAGLAGNLARNGFLPLVDRTFDHAWVDRASIYVTVAPRRSFTAAELARLRGLLDRGGQLVVATGWEEKGPAASLLALAGFDIDAIPLGPVPVLRKIADPELFRLVQEQPHFGRAWALNGVTGSDDVLYESSDFPIVVRRAAGPGQVVVIADPLFLLNRTLEQEGAAWPGNVAFLRTVFSRAALATEHRR